MKKFSTKLRQFLSAALAALLAVSLLPLSATAAGEEYLYRVVGVGNKFTISGNYGGRFTQGKVGQFDDILMGPSRSNLREVYCLQFMVPSGQNEGSDMSRNEIDAGNYDELTQEQIQRINYAVAFGYNDYTKDNPSWAYAYDRDSARWATQALIWSIAEGVFNGPNEAALVADVTEEPAQAGVVAELVADLVLLQLVPGEDDDPSRVVVVEHFTQEGLAEGAGPTGDEDGGTVEERHADLFRRRG